MIPDLALSLLETDEFKARRANTDSYANIPKMLKANRYNYGLFVLDDLMEAKFSSDFQIVKIRRFSINHVIHKKHIDLLPQLEEKIRIKLPEFLARREKRMTAK